MCAYFVKISCVILTHENHARMCRSKKKEPIPEISDTGFKFSKLDEIFLTEIQ